MAAGRYEILVFSHRIKSQPCVCPEPRLSLISQRQGTYVNTTQTSITYATATVNAVQDYSPSQQHLSKVNGTDEKNKVLSFTVAPLPENGHYFQNSIGPPLILSRHIHIRDKALLMPRRNGPDPILRAFLGQGHSLLILRRVVMTLSREPLVIHVTASLISRVYLEPSCFGIHNCAGNPFIFCHALNP